MHALLRVFIRHTNAV